ncbi:replication protein A 70 kDa DNA-binding subunit B [Artemisia annua]|uniref:Replication protein A 70 kDa DNA-binding subunit B n=1 Tax=Artemisia annua TaxID=35608 RepID=A0A2U1LNX4_ARTAN|nr:replication protein A 70 kDa DNA-binding subunit B [Artemisia annua]
MATYVSGFINDLSAVKDNIKLRVRIVRSWMQDVYGRQGVKNMELEIMDEQGTKMQATMRMALVNGFKHKLPEGSAVTLSRYSLGEIQPKYRMVNKPLRLSFLSNTIIEPFPDFTGSVYGFDFRPFKTITDLQLEEDGQFDVIGYVVACDDLDNYDKNGRSGKKKPLTLADADGNELKCTLWGAYAQQFQDFVDACPNRGKMGFQNGYNGTRLFLFNGHESIPKEEFVDVELYRLRLFANKDEAKSENTASRIPTQLFLFNGHESIPKEEFVDVELYRLRLFANKDEAKSENTASRISTQLFLFNGHESIPKEEFVDVELYRQRLFANKDEAKSENTASRISTQSKNSTREEFLNKLQVKNVVELLDVDQIRVQDESGTISLSLFNDEVQAMVCRSAYQLCDKYGCKNLEDQDFPKEITNLVGKKYAFKVSIDEVNSKKMLPVFTVLRLTDDAEILNSVVAIATPLKDAEATSSAVPQVTPLDLESQTDENTTPVEKQKSSKRASDVEHESDGSSIKRQILDIKLEKAAK